MKYLLIISSFFISLYSWSDIDYNDLIEKEGLYYESRLFTGKVVGKEQGKIIKGRKEGEWLSFYWNGKIECKTFYKGGKKEGEIVWYYSGGEIMIKGNYIEGLQEGKWMHYDKKGNLTMTEVFKNGRLIEETKH